MSDLAELDQKIQQGKEWRGTIEVELYGEQMELMIRQLLGPEFEEVMKLINRQELKELRDEMPTDAMEAVRDLGGRDDLGEDEEEALSEAREAVAEADVDPMSILSSQTLEGLRTCAQYAVVPDDEDLREAFTDEAPRYEREYGIKVKQPEDLREPLEDEIADQIADAPQMGAINIGMQALVETIGDDEGK